ncbi:MAG: EamA family transporter, partial [Nitratireductor sp.]|nr:EamA family transporter [Nitratireductor sp.]
MKLLRWLTGQPYLLLISCAIVWAGNAIAGRLAAGHISPYLLTTLRWAVASAVLLAIARPILRRDWKVIVRHWPYLAVMGAVGFTLFNNL